MHGIILFMVTWHWRGGRASFGTASFPASLRRVGVIGVWGNAACKLPVHAASSVCVCIRVCVCVCLHLFYGLCIIQGRQAKMTVISLIRNAQGPGTLGVATLL